MHNTLYEPATEFKPEQLDAPSIVIRIVLGGRTSVEILSDESAVEEYMRQVLELVSPLLQQLHNIVQAQTGELVGARG